MSEPSPNLIAEVASQQRHLATLMAEMGNTLVGVATRADMLERILTATRADQPTPLEAAMHSVWLHGNWRWLTRNMTTEQREAAADAVQRYSDHLASQDDDMTGPVADLRWWRS